MTRRIFNSQSDHLLGLDYLLYIPIGIYTTIIHP
ncbi:hypothetical protein MED16_gp69 [Pantoea phage vB_PagS_MED16]|nr:hypothetical protein MED16_gp69 [Pantoea phage vB_PagS_MED16]